MQTESIHLKPFTPDHLDGALALSREAGWPHRLEDWAMVQSLSTGIAAVEKGRVVGTAFLTPYGEISSAVNLVIVDQALRGRGLGRRLMAEALAATAGRECRLIATEDGLPLYEKLGFKRTHSIVQYQGYVADIAEPEGVEWAENADLTQCAKLDATAFGAARAALFGSLGGTAKFAVIRDDNTAVAFAALRPFGQGELIGPVVAENSGQAIALIRYVIAARSGDFLRIDMPEACELAAEVTALGLAPVGAGIGMAVNACTTASRSVHTYALASQALG